MVKILVLTLISTFPFFGFTQVITSAKEQVNSKYEFHYEDIERFRDVLKVAQAKGDTLAAMKYYFENGSEGMKSWIHRYDHITPELMVKTINYFPKYYENLSHIDRILKQYESEIIKGLDGLKDLYHSKFVHLPPIYYFILFSGGGSIEMTANMISVDYFGLYDGIDIYEFDKIGGLFPKGKFPLVKHDLIPQVVIHETVHLLQSYVQGEFNYASIYEEGNQTMLAYAIREGGAEFLTYLSANIEDENRNRYGDIHEKELWKLFKSIAYDNVNDHKGWFFGKSDQHPDWPFQIGYYLGYKMVEYYYMQAPDKKKAINQILFAHTKEDFKNFIELYSQKWK